MNLIKILEEKTKLEKTIIENIIKLLEDGCTIPFIARYRKDYTNSATDEQLRKFEDIYEYSKKLLNRKEEIKDILKERGFLDEKTLKDIELSETLTNLEDIYSVFKEKKSSRTLKAIENGLEPMANIIQSMKYTKDECFNKAKQFLNKDVLTEDDVINGAKDIIAQRYADDVKSKEIIRNSINNWASLEISAGKEFKKDGLYSSFENTNEKLRYIKSHRILAILRAVNENELKIKIEIDEKNILENIKKYKIPSFAQNSSEFVFDAYKDGLKRLLLPSLKKEAISDLKQRAESEAIELFGKNLKELLQTAPLVNQVILGVDPGYKTGCKLAVIDENGLYLDSGIIYPTKPREDFINSKKIILEVINKYKITAIAIGNGTASREAAIFIDNLIKEEKLDISYAIVSEIGASVYSASKIASQEYPNIDVTIRGAISIAQRLRDPMAALVKIDPKSLGIGQYQHDVNQKELAKKLENTTIDLVNKVGVDLNSASYKLLSFVSGISEKLAQNIVEYREKIKNFKTKSQLLKVKGLGTKSYEQSVGFLRIKDGDTILDNTAIHPEDYEISLKLQKDYKIEEIKDFEEVANDLNTTSIKVKDIVNELLKPGYDVRLEFNQIKFANDILDINDLKEGFILSGIVRNITDFGAFVDIGLKNDALLHISQISQKRLSHPSEVLSINQNLENLKVLSIDLEKQRVGLSLK
ncbi:helix-hairpin-helix domain-containing protein [Aliarcobacter thereius]|uniref:30S ribosomal protein S1 n=2 Tax=Aliarcobacter thereius TaxID=544718 RepID=A0A1C0B5U9_9BACT|nr:Tex-like N-terminal domain-containing protein [Aliarcobacter thereius]OCL90389.1 30S ribosomal protein S1 [Aliarcobacter thereius]OCL95856.1 30S ribosomal protein S1 [Aliarcobacter thereius LMG 24486]OCL98425.1 30S ribosomal protein S1 [Aliarcobacter thereius]QBF16171.1 transcriptional accessory protein Tex [Aliarcobacter thereius LMG 24486]